MTRFQKLMLKSLAVTAYIGSKVAGVLMVTSENQNEAEHWAGMALLFGPETTVCILDVGLHLFLGASACFRDCRDAWNEDQQVPLAGNQNDIVEV